jgi:hypothetical protein
MKNNMAELIWTILPILIISIAVALLIAGADSLDKIVWGR